jgi:molybdopterin converting factor small subunit
VSETIRVNVRFGGTLSSVAGLSREAVNLASGATVGDLIAMLVSMHETLGESLPRALAITDGRRVGEEERLSDLSEVSFVPPVAGG